MYIQLALKQQLLLLVQSIVDRIYNYTAELSRDTTTPQ